MEKKEKATSTSYTLKAIVGHIATLRERELISAQEFEQMMEIHKKALEAWMAKEFGQ